MITDQCTCGQLLGHGGGCGSKPRTVYFITEVDTPQPAPPPNGETFDQLAARVVAETPEWRSTVMDFGRAVTARHVAWCRNKARSLRVHHEKPYYNAKADALDDAADELERWAK